LAKIRITLTIDEKLAGEIDQLYRKRLKEALNKDEEKLPKQSTLYEDVLREGWAVYRRKLKV